MLVTTTVTMLDFSTGTIISDRPASDTRTLLKHGRKKKKRKKKTTLTQGPCNLEKLFQQTLLWYESASTKEQLSSEFMRAN